METTYLIAKYVDDLSRNEPRNVGVIVVDGERSVARFDGESNGQVDGRKIRFRIPATQTYKSWVEYWTRVLEEPAAAEDGDRRLVPHGSEMVEFLLTEGSVDFYLERGGSFVLDLDQRPIEAVTNELFERLVREPEPPGSKSLRERSKDALRQAGAPLDDTSRFRVDEVVSLSVAGTKVPDQVSFTVKNGRWHALQEVGFRHDRSKVSQREAGHAFFVFEHGPWRDKDQRIVLYEQSEVGSDQAELLRMLEHVATPVDVGDTERAAEILGDRLHLT